MVIRLHKQGAFGKGKILTTVKRDITFEQLCSEFGRHYSVDEILSRLFDWGMNTMCYVQGKTLAKKFLNFYN